MTLKHQTTKFSSNFQRFLNDIPHSMSFVLSKFDVTTEMVMFGERGPKIFPRKMYRCAYIHIAIYIDPYSIGR